MLLNQKVKVRWGSHSKKHFELLGYIFTKIGDEFEVELCELTLGMSVKVKYECDYCQGENQIEEKDKWKSYHDLMRRRSDDNKDCCNNRSCKNKKISSSHFKSNTTRKSLIEKFPEIEKEWNYEKNNKSPNEYSYGSNHLVWWKCEKGHEWEMTIKKRTREKSRCGCPYCSNKKVFEGNSLKNTYPDIAKEWHPILNGKLTASDVVFGSGKKAWWKCKDCNYEWKSQIYDRTQTKTCCPVCAESKGEKDVRRFLECNNMNFKPQYTFEDLLGIGGRELRFDFAVLDEKNKLDILIEYDGEFHFRKIFEDDGHEIIVEHDKRKNKYCEDKNISLLRIPYWEFANIESILHNELNKNYF